MSALHSNINGLLRPLSLHVAVISYQLQRIEAEASCEERSGKNTHSANLATILPYEEIGQ